MALSFISFWRGASIVLSDLASSLFYAGGAAEDAVGRAAPWFVLAVMLFSFAVRSVYLESCGKYVRGGVYVVVRDSLGPVMAKSSVSARVFDYILTGPISVVSAWQYRGALLNEISGLLHQSDHSNVNRFAAGAGILITIHVLVGKHIGWWAAGTARFLLIILSLHGFFTLIPAIPAHSRCDRRFPPPSRACNAATCGRALS